MIEYFLDTEPGNGWPMRALLYRPAYLGYRYLYAPFMSRMRQGPAKSTSEWLPCQICGQPGHVERFRPKAKEMGFGGK